MQQFEQVHNVYTLSKLTWLTNHSVQPFMHHNTISRVYYFQLSYIIIKFSRDAGDEMSNMMIQTTSTNWNFPYIGEEIFGFKNEFTTYIIFLGIDFD